jgi:hypothetical protein
MAFNKQFWSGNIAGVGFGGPKMHSYSDTAALATVAGANYFDAIGDEMDTGDVVYVYSSAASGGGGKMYVMTKNDATKHITLAALS